MKKSKQLSSLLHTILLVTTLSSCDKQDSINRFLLADEFNIDGKKLTLAFDKMKGAEGANEIKAMMVSYRNNPPKSINNNKVIRINDYETLI